MRDSTKLSAKCGKKAANSPSKMQLSTSMSSQENDSRENVEGTVEDDDDVVIKIDSTSTRDQSYKTFFAAIKSTFNKISVDQIPSFAWRPKNNSANVNSAIPIYPNIIL